MKIIFSGGGTLGPVTPLLALHETIKSAHSDAQFVWIGTPTGPERQLVEAAAIPFITIRSGKLRRYLSILNISDIINVVVGFFQSLKIIWHENPSVCISAGGYTSVPVHFAAWLFGIPTWIHQQDVDVGLANKLMSPAAKVITTALEQHKEHFPTKKTLWLGNPVRRDVMSGSRDEALRVFELDNALPVIFATGGGTGSLRVNQLVVEAVQHLEGVAQIIHLSGRERPQELVSRAQKQFAHYQVHQFFGDQMKHAYAAADLIISRGGFGTLSEIAALEKPAILIPKPGHQQDNVKLLAEQKAVVLVDETLSSGVQLASIVRELLRNDVERRRMGKQLGEMLPRAQDENVLEVLKSILN